MDWRISFWLGAVLVLAGIAAFSMAADAASQVRPAAGLLTFGVFETLLGGTLMWDGLAAARPDCNER